MGVDAADFDGDGDHDLFVTNLTGETNTLYRNDGGGRFDDVTAASGLGPPSLAMTGFGTGFADFDNDGCSTCSSPTARSARSRRWPRAATPSPTTRPRSSSATRATGPSRTLARDAAGLVARAVGRGTALGDVDNDGDTDLLVGDGGGPALARQPDREPPALARPAPGQPAGATPSAPSRVVHRKGARPLLAPGPRRRQLRLGERSARAGRPRRRRRAGRAGRGPLARRDARGVCRAADRRLRHPAPGEREEAVRAAAMVHARGAGPRRRLRASGAAAAAAGARARSSRCPVRRPSSMVPAARVRYEELRRAVSLASGPDAAAAWADLGRTALAYELLDAALPCFRNAARLEPGSPDWPYYQAVVDQRRGTARAPPPASGACWRWCRTTSRHGSGWARWSCSAAGPTRRSAPSSAPSPSRRSCPPRSTARAALMPPAATTTRPFACSTRCRRRATGSVVHYVLGQELRRAGAVSAPRRSWRGRGSCRSGSPIRGWRMSRASPTVSRSTPPRNGSPRPAATATRSAPRSLSSAGSRARCRRSIARWPGGGRACRAIRPTKPAILATAGALLEAGATPRADWPDSRRGRARSRRPAGMAPPRPVAAASAGHLEEALRPASRQRSSRPATALPGSTGPASWSTSGGRRSAARDPGVCDAGPDDAAARLSSPARSRHRDGRRRHHRMARGADPRPASDGSRSRRVPPRRDPASPGTGRRGGDRGTGGHRARLPPPAGAWFNLGAALARSGRFRGGDPRLRPCGLPSRRRRRRRGWRTPAPSSRLGRTAAARAALEDAVRALPASAALAHQLARLLAAAPEPSCATRSAPRRWRGASRWTAATPERVETLAIALAAAGRGESAADRPAPRPGHGRGEARRERLAQGSAVGRGERRRAGRGGAGGRGR